MLHKVLNIKPIANFFARESVIKRLLAKYVMPFYLMLKGGKIRTDDYVIFVDHRDHKGVINFAHSLLHNNVEIEPYEVRIFSTLVTIHPEAIVFDIGANYGMYTLAASLLRRQTDSISIVAVEADQRVFNCLKKSVVYNKYEKLCKPVHAAVGSCHGNYCRLARHWKQSSFNFTLPLNSHGCPSEFERSDVLRMVTVDELAEELGIIPKKVIIKIDIEGNEFHAVRGMKGILNACYSYVIFCEYSAFLINRAGNRPEEFWEELFTLESDGIYEINSAAKSLVLLSKESANLLSENREYTNLLIVKNIDLSAFF